MKTKRLLTALLFVGGVISASANDYYVSPEGAGTKDGSSWENAWGVSELQTKFTYENALNFDNGDNFYFAGGKYLPTVTLYVRMGLNLIGSTEGERTVFSGDINSDGIVNASDRDRLFQINTAIKHGDTEKRINISNIDMKELYFSQNEYGNATVGAIYMDNCGALVTISNCNFSNLINTGQGGSALLLRRSNVEIIDCKFTDIKAANRGIIARLISDNSSKGYTTFKNCLFADNEATGENNVPCGVVMLQYGQELNIINCTFTNNMINGNGASIWNGTEPDATYKRTMNVTNCLFYGNSSADNQNILSNSASTTTNSVIHDDATSAAINISGVGVGTYYLSLPFTMPEGVTGKTISGAADGKLTIGETYSAGDVVPAGTALLVEGSEGSYAPFVAESDLSVPANLLKGSDVAETTTGGDKYFKLANDPDDGLGFYWAKDGGAAFTNGAHKAYLALTGAQARFFSLDFDSETTGISTATTKAVSQGKFVENGSIVIVRNGIKYNAQGIKL